MLISKWFSKWFSHARMQGIFAAPMLDDARASAHQSFQTLAMNSYWCEGSRAFKTFHPCTACTYYMSYTMCYHCQVCWSEFSDYWTAWEWLAQVCYDSVCARCGAWGKCRFGVETPTASRSQASHAEILLTLWKWPPEVDSKDRSFHVFTFNFGLKGGFMVCTIMCAFHFCVFLIGIPGSAWTVPKHILTSAGPRAIDAQPAWPQSGWDLLPLVLVVPFPVDC